MADANTVNVAPGDVAKADSQKPTCDPDNGISAKEDQGDSSGVSMTNKLRSQLPSDHDLITDSSALVNPRMYCNVKANPKFSLPLSSLLRETSREWPKSAPYLRLNETRKPLFLQLETTKALKKLKIEKTFFRFFFEFFLKSPVSRIVPKM